MIMIVMTMIILCFIVFFLGKSVNHIPCIAGHAMHIELVQLVPPIFFLPLKLSALYSVMARSLYIEPVTFLAP